MGWERWRRVPEPGACDFCLMLATRGAVYASQSTAGKDNDYHAHCHCDQESEGNFDARTDIKVDPGDAERVVEFRHERSGYSYTYDLSRFRNVGVSDVPELRGWTTPQIRPVARIQDAATGGTGSRPTYAQLTDELDRVAPRDNPDLYYAYLKEARTAGFLRDDSATR